jgi:arylsulfatase A-like enzyme
MINAREIIGTHDVLFVTFDSLRYDVAVAALERGLIPNMTRVLPGGVWEERHSPGTFTLAAHTAFFSGFMPTPVAPGKHERLFASEFQGSITTGSSTFTYSEGTWIEALANRGYHTFCIGGVGFFNLKGELGSMLPNLFEHRYWTKWMGVGNPNSTENQVTHAGQCLKELSSDERAVMFINVSATHKPTHIFKSGATEESWETQLAAFAYTDKPIGELLERFQTRGPTLVILCADHGEAFGEDGYHGHRIAHPTVTHVPYAEFLLEEDS